MKFFLFKIFFSIETMKKNHEYFQVLNMNAIRVVNQKPETVQSFQFSVILFIFQFLKSHFEKDFFKGHVYANYVRSKQKSYFNGLFTRTYDQLYLYFPPELDYREMNYRSSFIPSCTLKQKTVELDDGNQQNFLVLNIKNPHFFYFRKNNLVPSHYQSFCLVLLFFCIVLVCRLLL